MRKFWVIHRYIKPFTILSTVAILGLGGSSASSFAEYYKGDGFFFSGSAIEVSMAEALKSGQVGRVKLYQNAAITEFYQDRENKPFWVGSSGARRNARMLLGRLEDSWTHGLNPGTYHVPEIVSLMESGDGYDKARLELLLTDGFVRYAQDLSGMRVDGKPLRLDREDWLQPVGASEVLGYLQDGISVVSLLNRVTPNTNIYNALREELIRLADDDAQYSYEAHLPIKPGGILKPGWGHKTVAQVRGRLGLSQPEKNQYYYDDDLAAAVMVFQRENGLNADGVIGGSTLERLNRTKKDKVLQIIANLERLRWVDPDMGERYVVVNIPSSTLWAIDDGQVKLEMPVIVGSPWRRTRSFKTYITGMRFNPTWTIPPTVKRFDILPAIQEDVNFLYERNIELYKGYGSERVSIDPLTVDWEAIEREELNSLRMVQMPGDNNPLGRFRVLMPNPYNMYLHDTNHPDLFNEAELALSSGCMRMKEPEKMARFVLEGSEVDIASLLEEGKETDIRASQKVPVYIFYNTMWLDGDGDIVYGNDIYNYDKKLLEVLSNIDGFAIPGHYKTDHKDDGKLTFLPK